MYVKYEINKWPFQFHQDTYNLARQLELLKIIDGIDEFQAGKKVKQFRKVIIYAIVFILIKYLQLSQVLMVFRTHSIQFPRIQFHSFSYELNCIDRKSSFGFSIFDISMVILSDSAPML